MTISSIGDLAQSLSMRQHNANLRTDFQRLTKEIATGQHHDLTETVQGGFRPLAGLETSLTRLSGYEHASRQAVLLNDGVQSLLEQVNARSSEMAPRLLSSANSGNAELLAASSQAAEVEFEGVVSALNTQVAGRTLLAGQAIDTTPLAPAQDILSAAKIAMTGLTTASDISVALDTWFDTGGSFETDHYNGSTIQASPLTVGEGITIEEPLTAIDDQIKATLKGFIMAAIVSENTNALPAAERAALAADAAETLIGASTGLVQHQGRVGANQGVLESRLTEIGAERHAVEMARSAITAIDPYEAATELQNVESSLELLYTITARLSRLNLSDFLR
ncbi:flagellin [Cognatishimia sp. MH4019]|uniref:flagellin n=1 Tax=Cognatishimia sp. MH4019 TaxID=2854030 RepID=UPI001CD7D6FF|nr:flagellin [Cognatishimia sp. MH4019]